MSETLQRKGAIGTIAEAADWLVRNPVLLPVFFVVGVIDALGEASFLFSVLGFAAVIVADGIAHRFAFAEVRGTQTNVVAETEVVFSKFLSLAGATIVYVIAVIIGLILLIIPGIYLGLRLSLAFPAIVIDDQGMMEGLETSWEVAKGNLLKLLGIWIIFLVGVFSVVISLLIVGGTESLGLTVALSAILTAIIAPIVQLAYARVYLENRGSTVRTDDGGWGSDTR
ncbi:glycerophosphoryl diester phosphodiesterase membrane domain-containing protein [Natronobiforma cellulositropha]|uniref:glycerophosphoryl diester phosphodiesterase membrane domain-containing protein n=1 Tax=Natronobiforma cellulositropha TaxID=1679076 RepID=UPI0021D583AF|nr:glycerophosphoryl diester phosphodiesterase membrane domain-containing protein [Natronobiforma cellulositropha]